MMAGSICCGSFDVVGEVVPVSAGGGTAACFDGCIAPTSVLAGVDAADVGSVNCVKLKSTVLLVELVLNLKSKGFEAEAAPLPAADAVPKSGRVLLVARVKGRLVAVVVDLKSKVLLDAVVLKLKTKGFKAEAPPLPAADAVSEIGRVLPVAGVDLKSKKGFEAEAPP